MKIAFVGKGGSGKTTISSTLAKYLAAEAFPVLAIDADINQHFGQSLGLSEEESMDIPPMGLEMGKIKTYLRGENKLIHATQEMIKTTPPGHGSNLIKIQEENPIYNYFTKKINGVDLMAVGAFTEDDLGVKCYHSKTGAVELLLNHMIDKEREYVIVDMTAGADSFASGLFTRFDVTFLVVEPTIKSTSVYKQYKKYAEEYDVCIRVIGNKINDQDDIDFIHTHVGEDLVATFTSSQYIRAMEKGSFLPISNIEPENKKTLVDIKYFVDSREKNWRQFYDQAVLFHKKNAASWANVAVGKNLEEQIDPDFNLAEVVSKM